MKLNSTIIISLGGSLIHTKNGINISFIKKYNDFIRRHVKKGKRFFIICGGGYITREYQRALSSTIANIPNEDLDWLGIHATKLNAQLLRVIFADLAYPKIIFKYDRIEPNITNSIVIAAGWKPGWSTDYDAVLLARDYESKTIINMSNINSVYTKDPNKYPDAKPIEKICWDEFMQYVGDKWIPGANTPFDPIAAKLARKLKLTAVIVNGTNLENLENVICGKSFIGTTIYPCQ